LAAVVVYFSGICLADKLGGRCDHDPAEYPLVSSFPRSPAAADSGHVRERGIRCVQFYCGHELWLRSPGAPRFVRIFLIISTGCFVAVEQAFFRRWHARVFVTGSSGPAAVPCNVVFVLVEIAESGGDLCDGLMYSRQLRRRIA
jgi:hypothetical protein